MLTNLLIFLGCGLGGLLRFWMNMLMFFLFGSAFPVGTLVVNVSGSFLMGFLFSVILHKFDGDVVGQILRSFLLIGFLGGYTTFSSFSLETINLFETGCYVSAILNVILSVILCILAAWIGIYSAR